MGKSLRRRPPSTTGKPSSPRLQSTTSGRRSSAQSSSGRSSPATPQSKVRKRLRVRASSFATKSARRTRTRRQLQADLDASNLSEDPTRSPSLSQSGRQTTDDGHDESVDKLLRDVRSLMRSKAPSTNSAENDQDDVLSLRDALKRADNQFRQDSAPSAGSSSASTTEAAREELGVVETVPSPPKSSKKKKGKNTPLLRERSTPEKSKKPPRTPQTERLARLRARLEKSRLTPEARSNSIEKDSDDSDMEMNLFDHKNDIEALKKDDPEFYKFLEENDAGLLDVDDLALSGDILADSEEDDDVSEETRSKKDDLDGDHVVKHSDSTRGTDQKGQSSRQYSENGEPKSAARSSALRHGQSKSSPTTTGLSIQARKDISTEQSQGASVRSSAGNPDHRSGENSDDGNTSDSDSSSSDSVVEDDIAGDIVRKDHVSDVAKDVLQSNVTPDRTPKRTTVPITVPTHDNSKSANKKQSPAKLDGPSEIAKTATVLGGSGSCSEGVKSGDHDGTSIKVADARTGGGLSKETHVVSRRVSSVGASERRNSIQQSDGDSLIVTVHSDSSDSESVVEEDIVVVEKPPIENATDPAVVIVDGDDESSDPELNDADENASIAKTVDVPKQPVQSSSALSDHEDVEPTLEVSKDTSGLKSPGSAHMIDVASTQVPPQIESNKSTKSPGATSKGSGSAPSTAAKTKKRSLSRRGSAVDDNNNSTALSKGDADTADHNGHKSSKSIPDVGRLAEEGPERRNVRTNLDDGARDSSTERLQNTTGSEVPTSGTHDDGDRTGYSSDDDSEEERLEEATAAIEAGIVVDVANATDNGDKTGNGSHEPSALLDDVEIDNNVGIKVAAHVEGEADGMAPDGRGGNNGMEVVDSSSGSDGSDTEGNGKASGAGGGDCSVADSDEESMDGAENEASDESSGVATLDNEVDPAVDEQPLVDLKYLRSLKELIDSHRAGVKVCKSLLLIFQSGRDILPRSIVGDGKGRSKSGSTEADEDKDARGAEPGLEEDEYEKDGTLNAGKLKFASAKAYQQAMNLAIIGLQDVLDRLLDKPGTKKAADVTPSKWVPSNSARWSSLQPLFRGYVYNMLGLCDSVVDPPTLRFLLRRLERVAPYTFGNEDLAKKILRVVLRIWSSDLQHVSQETRLQAYLLLNKLAHVSGNTELVLKFCFNSFISNIAPTCNPKTFVLIRFAVACLVELYGIDMGASYSTLFSYLREMAVSLRSVLVSKDESEDIEKVHNWKFINELRLWSRVLGKYGEEDELQPLIYPYVQVALGVMGLHPTPRAFPLRLHIASFLIDLVQETGVYIPVVPNLLLLLRCSELKKHPKHSDVKGLEWRALLRVNEDTVKTKGFLSGLVDGVTFEISRFFAIISKHVSFPELSFVAESGLRKIAKSLALPEWKSKIITLATKLKGTADEVVKARAKADLAPQGAISERRMLACVPGLDPATKMPIERLFEVERDRMQKQNRLRDEVSSQKRPNPATTAEDDGKTDSSASDVEPKARAAKKAKISTSRKGKSPSNPSLQVPNVNDDDEQDQVAKLDLDSDSSGSE